MIKHDMNNSLNTAASDFSRNLNVQSTVVTPTGATRGGRVLGALSDTGTDVVLGVVVAFAILSAAAVVLISRKLTK
jgi:hypothetical protein